MAMHRKSKRKWIQAASREMARKGTKGAFGKATPRKIARAKAKGGLAKKRAVFAQNLRRIAAKREAKRGRKRTARR